jgi:hypothetical protein
MKLVGDLLKYLALAGTVLTVCLGLWLASLLWHSPNYAETGTCTVAEIDRTAAEIEAYQANDAIAGYREYYEFSHYHPQVQTMQGHVTGAVNVLAFRTVGKRQTAAFLCNHAQRHIDGIVADTLPQLVDRLGPYEADEKVRWRLAMCMTARARNIGGPNGLTFAQLQAGCAKWPWRRTTR